MDVEQVLKRHRNRLVGLAGLYVLFKAENGNETNRMSKTNYYSGVKTFILEKDESLKDQLHLLEQETELLIKDKFVERLIKGRCQFFSLTQLGREAAKKLENECAGGMQEGENEGAGGMQEGENENQNSNPASPDEVITPEATGVREMDDGSSNYYLYDEKGNKFSFLIEDVKDDRVVKRRESNKFIHDLLAKEDQRKSFNYIQFFNSLPDLEHRPQNKAMRVFMDNVKDRILEQTNSPTSSEYEGIAVCLILKYKFFVERVSTGCAIMKNKVINKLQNHRRPKK